MKRLSFAVAALMAVLLLRADPVLQHEALAKAVQFLAAHRNGHAAQQTLTLTRRQSRRQAPASAPTASSATADASAAYYVFNIEAGGGFVIVGGDDRLPDVLGYADSGAFTPDSLPPGMEDWLRQWEEQAASRPPATSLSAPLRAPAVRHSVAPLLTTTWNQNDPYNRLLLDKDKYKNVCYTGCVATAMAQLLCYHARLTGQPRSTTADIPAYTTATYHYDVEGVTAGTTLDWAAMQDSYYANVTAISGEQQRPLDAVARLMHICGASVRMNYSTSNSGANSWDVPQVLKTCFGYDPATRMADRRDYTMSQWNELIYRELADRRPVYFTGASSASGHAFIVDGYDGDERFHINWGWGGHCNGYYLLSLANPTDKEGIGAGTSDDGYTMRQGAIIGAQPDTGREPADTLKPQPATGKTVRLAVSGVNYEGTFRAKQSQKAAVTIVNQGDEFYGNIHFITKKIGLIFKDTCSVGVTLLPGQEQTLPFSFKPLEEGQYTVTIVTGIDSLGVLYSSTIDILPSTTSNYNVDLGIDMEITNLDSSGRGILGKKAHLRTTVSNPSSTAYEGIFVPLLAAAGGVNFSVRRERFEPYSTTVLERDFDVLPGYSYLPLCITDIPDRQQVYQSPRRYYSVSSAVIVSFADGTTQVCEAEPSAVIPADAVAVDLVGNYVTTEVTPSANPNCIYYLSAGAVTPAGLGSNVVKGTRADRLLLSDGYPFMPTSDFTADSVMFTLRFDRGTTTTATGSDRLFIPSWTTICLPFTADRCLLDNGRQVEWRRGEGDSAADFWLQEFLGDEDDTLFFAPAQAMRAYTPYLVSVPAAGVEGKPDMTAAPVTFCGRNAAIKAKVSSVLASTHYKFVGTMHTLTDSDGAYAIGTDGRQCRRQTVAVPPFRAWVKAVDGTVNADAVALSIAAGMKTADDLIRKADVNGDGRVDVADITAVIAVMAEAAGPQSGAAPDTATGTGGVNADVNGDGTVDVADITAVIAIIALL